MKMIKVSIPITDEQEINAVADVLRSGRYADGPKAKEFEDEFAKFIGAKYAIATSSGTSSLHLSLIALGIKPGDEVIVPPLTFFATVEAVLHQGATPVFADLDPDTYCIDPIDVEKKISEKTRAVIPVHFFGMAAEMDHICDIGKSKNIKIIEDCAQAHGTEYKGKKVGTFGDANCWSFYATKNMTTGEGGMVTTNNEDVANKIRAIRNHGMTNRNDHVYLGYNYRMSEIHAAIGIVQLKKLDMLNKKRICNSNKLRKGLESLSWLEAQHIPNYVKHTFFWCAFKIDEEKIGMSGKQLREFLLEKGLEVRHRYTEPLYKQPVLLENNFNGLVPTELDYSKVFLPNVEKIAGRLIGLPNHPGLSNDDINEVISIMKKVKTK
ncbi:DegT/DnrJ/EryC1/StrS family aminotransferase [Nitrosopumilus sp. K4]|uniref:DegT/DnrJ/EryC1/StrS family aminotransferase n=1 Tax=Nitrosopumilus sp. K4 TaxID=2795383 RepID=UPI001BAE0D49|nr:DegT/DnrJ/EryC1/StrS family aminotransferase [Nitrosopumilus sp. K4]QUC64517.1 DegT/DnrJ/EryC1/StrS family aminotransferase [Nitrosopumilus sp. K4]